MLDFGRGLAYITNSTLRDQAFDWYASHIDIAELHTQELKSRNPNMKTFAYELDLTYCLQEYCQHWRAPNTELDALPENYFLHFSEETSITFKAFGETWGNVDIPGCPEETPATKECRVQTAIWNGSRYVFNQADPDFRNWMAQRLLDSATSQNVDGIFLDEHGPGFVIPLSYDMSSEITSGGGVREYNNGRPNNIGEAYNADVAGALAVEAELLNANGLFLLPNTAAYVPHPWSVDQAVAAKGVYAEQWWKPDAFDQNFRERGLNAVKQVTDAGGMFVLGGPWGYEGSFGTASGNYNDGASRYRMWRLAGYYIVKESSESKGVVYFDPGLRIDYGGSNPLSFIQEWEQAYEFDLGEPSGPPTLHQTGPTGCWAGYEIYVREYENALVLLRPRDAWNCQDWDDTATVNLPSAMRLLNEDGSLGQATTSVSVRNGEGVIMIKGKVPMDPTR